MICKEVKQMFLNLFKQDLPEQPITINLKVNEKRIIDWLFSKDRLEQITGDKYYKGIHDILFRKRTAIGNDGKLIEVDNLPNNKIIDNQYKKELNYFQVFDKQCNAKSYILIRELLIQSRKGSLTGAEDFFNKFRSEILENMKAVAIHFGIAPAGLSLNDFSRFLCIKEVEVKEKKYKLNKEVLPKALHLLMGHVIMMIQDGSHKRDIRYGVHQFVSENKDTLIIPSLLFAIIELMSWFIPYLATHTDKQQNLANWQIQD